jgi:aspartate racemase
MRESAGQHRVGAFMKTLGIVGGIGPESTIEYYRFIVDGCRTRGADSVPHIIIDSIDVNRGIAMLNANDLAGLTGYISASIELLTRAGAEIGLIAANTPHIVFDEVQARCDMRLISLVQAACDRAQTLGLKRLGLLGTGFTMRGDFYPKVFARVGIELVTPKEGEKELIHSAYINELLKNNFRADTRTALVNIIERMRDDDAVTAVLLAGTELPLLLRGGEPTGVSFLDTTLIHVDAAVAAICL